MTSSCNAVKRPPLLLISLTHGPKTEQMQKISDEVDDLSVEIAKQNEKKAKEKDLKDREVSLILKRAEVHKEPTAMQRISMMNPEEIHSMKRAAMAGGCAGAGIGAWGGFLIAGGPASGPMCLVGAAGGTLVGAGFGAAAGAITFMIKSSKEYENWRKGQTEETIDAFKKVFKIDNFTAFCDPIEIDEIMQYPVMDQSGCTADYNSYVKHLESPYSIDKEPYLRNKEGEYVIMNGDRVPNPNHGKTLCIHKTCHVTKDQLRPNHLIIGQMITAFKDYIDAKPEFRPSKITADQLKGLQALLKDLDSKARWTFDIEERLLDQMQKKGIISIRFALARKLAIADALKL